MTRNSPLLERLNWPAGLVCLLILAMACSTDGPSPEPSRPVVSTLNAIPGSDGGVTLRGSYLANDFNITFTGFEYGRDSLFRNPLTISSDIDTNGSFESLVANGLIDGEKYFFRSFVEDDSGEEFYGESRDFVSSGSLAPRIDSVSTSLGHIGDVIEIYGEYLIDNFASTRVSFSGVNSPITFITDTLLRCQVPIQIQKEVSEITVSIDDRMDTFSPFTLYTPKVERLSPNPSAIGDTLTIIGDHFDTNKNRNRVFIGNSEVEVLEAQRTELRVVVPLNIRSSEEPVYVTAQLQATQSPENFNLKQPEIRFIAPEINAGGEIVLEGAYFHPSLIRNTLTIEGREVQLTSGNADRLTARIPLGPFPRRKFRVGLKVLDMNVEYEEEIEVVDKWLMVANLPFRFRRGPQNAAVVNQTAYVIAKEIDNVEAGPVFLWKFNPEDYTWDIASRELPPFDIFTSGNLETEGTHLYYYTSRQTDNFWKFNTATQTWQQLADFPGDRRDYAAHFSVGGGIYIGLGADLQSPLQTYFTDFYRFDTTSESWSRIDNVPFDVLDGTQRMGMNSFVLGNTAYLVGGARTTGDFDAWSYSMDTGIWQPIADFPYPLNESAAFVYEGRGYVSGGGPISGSNRNWTWHYTPATDSWEESESIIEPRGWHFSFVLDGRVYIGGGDNESGGAPLDTLYEWVPE